MEMSFQRQGDAEKNVLHLAEDQPKKEGKEPMNVLHLWLESDHHRVQDDHHRVQDDHHQVREAERK
jgi:hypothetical protein